MEAERIGGYELAVSVWLAVCLTGTPSTMGRYMEFRLLLSLTILLDINPSGLLLFIN